MSDLLLEKNARNGEETCVILLFVLAAKAFSLF